MGRSISTAKIDELIAFQWEQEFGEYDLALPHVSSKVFALIPHPYGSFVIENHTITSPNSERRAANVYVINDVTQFPDYVQFLLNTYVAENIPAIRERFKKTYMAVFRHITKNHGIEVGATIFPAIAAQLDKEVLNDFEHMLSHTCLTMWRQLKESLDYLSTLKQYRGV